MLAMLKEEWFDVATVSKCRVVFVLTFCLSGIVSLLFWNTVVAVSDIIDGAFLGIVDFTACGGL